MITLVSLSVRRPSDGTMIISGQVISRAGPERITLTARLNPHLSTWTITRSGKVYLGLITGVPNTVAEAIKLMTTPKAQWEEIE